MQIDDLQAELEIDMSWRVDEIRFLQNHGAILKEDDEKRRYRRAIILLLYAHFEGFCKIALLTYVKSINSEGLRSAEVNESIAAAAMSDVFYALRDPDKRSEFFKKDAPDDRELHRFARDKEFVERVRDLGTRLISVPEKVVNTESNLWPVVLRKNLYRLGLPHTAFKHLDGVISKLLNTRNDIGHGKRKDGLDEKEYLELRDAVFFLMSEVKRGVMEALSNKLYLNHASNPVDALTSSCL
ncbi:MAE_28990/MAE_18760 family HEPN-like nuclease [Azospirillum melinis]